MGRSSGSSCFRIIACAGEKLDGDDLQAPQFALQNKGSSDKLCKWSFGKRSTRHRVLSNTVISETTSGNNERQESANVELQEQASSPLPEKELGMQWTDEKPLVPTLGDSKSSETIAAEDDDKTDITPDESVIIIQAAIRGFLAQKTLLKHKNIVKLQAAVRGHLVRNHAVGTLRCVQAIVKMQALVRARRAHFSMEGSSIDGRFCANRENDNDKSNILGKENSGSKAPVTFSSIEKLLSNRFARQLLESKPRAKQIKIKCDPSKSDSAWNWLERWMSVSSRESDEQTQKLAAGTEQDKVEKGEVFVGQANTIASSNGSESTDIKTSSGEAAVPSESEENLITYDADNFNFQASRPSASPMSHNVQLAQPDDVGMSTSKENTQDLPHGEIKQSDLASMSEPRLLFDTPVMESEQPLHSTKGEASPEESEAEGKKRVVLSKKASNPAFLAAQSKFEELSSTAHSARSNSSPDAGVETCMNAASSVSKNAFRTREIGLVEDSVLYSSRVQAGSECGTEISISSTLDSPDRSEAGVMEFDKEQEGKALEDRSSNAKNNGKLTVEAKSESTLLGTELSHSILVQPEGSDDLKFTNGEPDNSVIAVDSLQEEQQRKKSASDIQTQSKPEMVQQPYKLSPEESPRSHITISESQGTPSSQISVKPKKTENEKTGSNKKRTSLSAGKRSSDHNTDSGATGNLEQLPKDHNNGKRRNSFGFVKPDHVDQEPRDSTSNNAIPNYMQATESARAKALAISSPRLSPDVHEKDIKKRHSLPGATGRQGSPHIQQSTSQTQQSGKKNEKKWQR